MDKKISFDEWLIGRIASGTIITYSSDVNIFNTWLKGRPVTNESIMDFLNSYKSYKTRYHYYYALKNYTEYIQAVNVDWNYIGKKLKWSKTQKKYIQPRDLTFEETRLLAKDLLSPYSDIVVLQFEFGARIREILMIGENDITPGSVISSNDSLKVVLHGKGGFTRTVYTFTEQSKDILLRLKANHVDGKIFPRRLFRYQRNRHTSNSEQSIRSIYHKVNDTIQQQAKTTLGKGKKLSTHWFRHGRILYLYEKGYDVRTIQKFTGHSSLDMLMKYLISAGVDTRLLVKREIEAGHNINWK